MTILVQGFSIDDAYTIEQLDAIEDLSKALNPTDSLFEDLPKIHLNEKQERSIHADTDNYADGTARQTGFCRAAHASCAAA